MPDLAPSCCYLPTLGLDFRSQSLETVYSPVRSKSMKIDGVRRTSHALVIASAVGPYASAICNRAPDPVPRPSVLASTTACGTKIMHPLQYELFPAPNYARGSSLYLFFGLLLLRFSTALTLAVVYSCSRFVVHPSRRIRIYDARAPCSLSPASLRMSALRRLPPESPRSRTTHRSRRTLCDPTDCLSTARMLCARPSRNTSLAPPLSLHVSG
ncbi:hypothetical protein B0H13DRAFT_2313376 [Mycena leptocephala]|nr:hypothetical protein B0H13DRAFT_2313376 [Mycena leptocephala]